MTVAANVNLEKFITLLEHSVAGDNLTNEDVVLLCQSTNTDLGHAAAMCVPVEFISITKLTMYGQRTPNVRVASLVSPNESNDIENVSMNAKQATNTGADEVEVIFPYSTLIKGEEAPCYELIRQSKTACGVYVPLKVALEIGALKTPELIQKATEIAINAGADIIKTSSDYSHHAITPDMFNVVLQTVKQMTFKSDFMPLIAGNVNTADEAFLYLDMAENVLGHTYISNQRFRISSTTLLNDILEHIA